MRQRCKGNSKQLLQIFSNKFELNKTISQNLVLDVSLQTFFKIFKNLDVKKTFDTQNAQKYSKSLTWKFIMSLIFK